MALSFGHVTFEIHLKNVEFCKWVIPYLVRFLVCVKRCIHFCIVYCFHNLIDDIPNIVQLKIKQIIYLFILFSPSACWE